MSLNGKNLHLDSTNRISCCWQSSISNILLLPLHSICKHRQNAPTLSDHAADESQLAQIFHCLMCDIRPRFVQIRPSQKASCPITLSGFVVVDEFIVIDGSVSFIQRICASSATVVS